MSEQFIEKSIVDKHINSLKSLVENANANIRNTNYKLKSTIELNQKLSQLLDVTKIIMSEIDLDQLLNIIMAKVTEVVNADRTTLFIIDKKKGEFISRVLQGGERNEIRFPMGKGIAGSVAESGEILNIPDVYQDERFNPEIDRQTGYVTKSLLCIPIKTMHNEVIGVAQALNKKDGESFTEEDVQLILAFSSLAAISLENALNFEKHKNIIKAFELFVPPNYLKKIAKHGVEEIKHGSMEKAYVTVLFFDIRDFSEFSQYMNPTEISQFLNDYFKQMNSIVSKHRGFIDKFIGDGFMAIFDEEEGGRDAIEAAIAIKKHLIAYNTHRNEQGLRQISIGMGISTGDCVIGTLGSSDRMDSTCIGSPVIIAKRIEGLTKYYKIPILISSTTLKTLKEPEKYLIREIDSVKVKGRTEPEVIYEIYNIDDVLLVDKKKTAYPDLLHAIALYKAHEWDSAIQFFNNALAIYPEDNVAQNYIRRCYYNKHNPPDENWDGTIDLNIQ